MIKYALYYERAQERVREIDFEKRENGRRWKDIRGIYIYIYNIARVASLSSKQASMYR